MQVLYKSTKSLTNPTFRTRQIRQACLKWYTPDGRDAIYTERLNAGAWILEGPGDIVVTVRRFSHIWPTSRRMVPANPCPRKRRAVRTTCGLFLVICRSGWPSGGPSRTEFHLVHVRTIWLRIGWKWGRAYFVFVDTFLYIY